MKKAFWFLVKTMEVVFIVFLLFIGSLFFREQRLPKFVVDRIAIGLSSERYLLACDGVAYGIGRGLTLSGIKLYELDSGNGISPTVSAKKLSIRLLARKVYVSGLKFPRLPESYYHGECCERDFKIDFRFPDVGEFDLELDEPEILGICPRTVFARVEMSPETLHFRDIRLVWPDLRRRMVVTGDLDLDLQKRALTSNIDGLATQPLIRPLLVALDLPSAYPYFDAFSDVAEPVDARGRFECDLGNGDFRMKLALKIGECKYNRVPFARADGILDLYVYTRGTNCNARLGVDLAEAVDQEGRTLSGRFGVDLSNEVVRLSFDAKSSLMLSDALDVADFLNDGTLNCIRCDSPPLIAVKGVCGVCAADKAANDLDFGVQLGCGSVYGYQVRDLAADFSLKGDAVEFRKITARGKDGGRLQISDRLEMPDFDGSRIRLNPKISIKGGSLNELADVFNFDLGERCGRVDAVVELAVEGNSNSLNTLSGKGSVKIFEGRLAKMKLFAGLTDLVAEKVPGVESLVTQTDASCDFTIDGGVVRSENICIEGGLVSLKAWGAYDMVNDNLDFTSQVQFLRNESLMGKLIHPIVWPFSKLLLEFKAKGPLDAANWEYISIIDRIL